MTRSAPPRPGSLSSSLYRAPAPPSPILPRKTVPVAVPTPSRPRPAITWAYAVTTHPSRRGTLLPATLRSLSAAGFDEPTLYVDGADCRLGAEYEREFGLPVSTRGPVPVRTAGHWFLTLAELYVRSPLADRYAVFQDDLIAAAGLRRYLDVSTARPPAVLPKEVAGLPTDPRKVYWNLYTFPSNQNLAPPSLTSGWYPSNQLGKGAVGLVFDRAGVLALLGSRHVLERPADPTRGWRAVDGAIVTALRKEGYTELVHTPSPLQHTGVLSSMKNRPHPSAVSFPGADFDLSSLLS